LVIKRKPKVGDKVMTLKDAVDRFIQDGDHLRIGGHNSGRSSCTINEIIRQGKKDLTVSGLGLFQELDVLIGAGVVKKLECSWFGLESSFCPCVRRAVENGIPQPLELVEYSHLSMLSRYIAGALGIPFMHVRSLKGSDLCRIGLEKGHMKEILCPFTDEKLIAVPACNPDVALFHAQRADRYGNVQVWGYCGDDDWGTRSAERVIVTVEEVVDSNIIKGDPNRVMVPGFMVDAVVEVPYGAHPWGVVGYYKTDLIFKEDYIRWAKNVDGFQEYLKEWVFDVSDQTEYIDKLGKERIKELQVEPYFPSAVNYGS
jgi:glutaconate CoA-transferase subunit A